MQLTFKKFSRFYLILIIVVLIVGVFLTFYIYNNVTRYMKESLLGSAEEVAIALGYQNINLLAANEADINSLYYTDIKRRLENIKTANKSVDAIYLIGYCKQSPCVLASSEIDNSPLYYRLGDSYFGDNASFEKVMLNQERVLKDVYSDSRGRWVSAFTPVIDTGNNVIAGVEMDMAASSYLKTAFLYSSIPAIITAVIILIIILIIIVEAREENLLEFKSELVSIATHEIRTPLTNISWLIDMILNSGENLSKSQRESVIMIRDQSQNLLLIINDLLDLSAEQNTVRKKIIKQQIIFKGFIEEVIKTFKLSIDKKSLEIAFDPSVTSDIAIFGDPYRLKRAFNNLVSNAVKYSNPNGKICIGCEPKEEQSVFWIKDDGIGIPEKDTSRVFTRFYRAENAKRLTEEGTGLGLNYAKQIVELHCGKIWCESKENQGSTFFVKLPKPGN